LPPGAQPAVGLIGVGACCCCWPGVYQPIANLANLFAPRASLAFSSFSEQYILFEVCKDRLQAADYRVEDCPSVSATIQGLAFRNNQIDFSVNYSGDVWSVFMGRKNVVGREKTYEQAKTFLRDKYGIECLGKVGFENAYALAMTAAAALGS
jgi:osmoprotectant transport system permease protein